MINQYSKHGGVLGYSNFDYPNSDYDETKNVLAEKDANLKQLFSFENSVHTLSKIEKTSENTLLDGGLETEKSILMEKNE